MDSVSRSGRLGLNIIGFIEQIDAADVRGWAYCPDAVDVHLEITISLDELVIGAGPASEAREDLRSLGFGDGDHGFIVPFEIVINPQDLDHIEVTATAPDGEIVRLRRVKGEVVVAEVPPQPPPEPLVTFPMPVSDTQPTPVFVLGAARSGTSAMAQGLLKCGHYEGFEEGHYLWMIRRFLRTIHTYYEDNGEDALPDRFTLLSRVPPRYMTSAVRAVFVASMSQLYPQGRWIDKTPRPEMIEASPLMQELWPQARFIFMKRRALENVSSRLTKFPTISFRDHCKDWSRSMKAWLLVRDLMGGAAMEVEQLATAREPERTANEVGAFLDLPEFAIRRLATSFASDRPERTTATFAPVMQIDKMGWTDQQIVQFRKICGPMMAAYGYGYTEAYFAGPMRAVTTNQIAG